MKLLQYHLFLLLCFICLSCVPIRAQTDFSIGGGINLWCGEFDLEFDPVIFGGSPNKLVASPGFDIYATMNKSLGKKFKFQFGPHISTRRYLRSYQYSGLSKHQNGFLYIVHGVVDDQTANTFLGASFKLMHQSFESPFSVFLRYGLSMGGSTVKVRRKRTIEKISGGYETDFKDLSHWVMTAEISIAMGLAWNSEKFSGRIGPYLNLGRNMKSNRINAIGSTPSNVLGFNTEIDLNR